MRLVLFLHVLGIALVGAVGSARAGAPSAPEITAGHKIYVAKCAKCHKFYDPTKYSDQQWQKWMGKMSRKAKLKPEQQEQLSRYVEEILRHPQKAGS